MDEELYKYFEGTLAEEEKDALFLKLRTDDALKKEFVALQNAVALSSMAARREDNRWSEKRLKELRRTVNKRKNRRLVFELSKYVAVGLLVVGSWLLSQHQTVNTYKNQYTWVEAPKGQRVSITLADKSTVTLNPSSRLRIPSVFDKGKRIVQLEGEAYFKISRNPVKPFVVMTKRFNVRVLGTEFNVFAYPESEIFETELVKGSVYVYDKDSESEGIYMKPNEKVSIEDGKLRKISSVYKQKQLDQTGIYDFSDMPFKDLLSHLGLWYQVRFRIDRPEILNQVYYGKFRQGDDIETIMKAISKAGKFKYKIKTDYMIEIY